MEIFDIMIIERRERRWCDNSIKIVIFVINIIETCLRWLWLEAVCELWPRSTVSPSIGQTGLKIRPIHGFFSSNDENGVPQLLSNSNSVFPRVTYCTAHPSYPRVFCWIYRCLSAYSHLVGVPNPLALPQASEAGETSSITCPPHLTQPHLIPHLTHHTSAGTRVARWSRSCAATRSSVPRRRRQDRWRPASKNASTRYKLFNKSLNKVPIE